MKRALALGLMLMVFAALWPHALAGKQEVFAYQGQVAFFAEDGKIGVIHKSGSRTMIAPIFEEARPFVGGLAAVKTDGLWGLIDQDSRWVFRAASLMPVDFGSATGDYGLYSPEPGYYGFIDRKGETVISPLPLMDAGVMAEDLFAAANEQGYGYLDKKAREVIPYQYEMALAFSQGLAAVKKDGKWGYINPQGETVLPFVYTEASSFAYGLAAVKAEGEGYVSYIDADGKTILSGEWDFGGDFTKDKLARVSAGGKYGFINQKGKAVIPLRYEDAADFSDGFAPVKTGQDAWVYLSAKGKVVSKNYLAAGAYQNGFALVTFQAEGGKGEPIVGYINTKRSFAVKLGKP